MFMFRSQKLWHSQAEMATAAVKLSSRYLLTPSCKCALLIIAHLLSLLRTHQWRLYMSDEFAVELWVSLLLFVNELVFQLPL